MAKISVYDFNKMTPQQKVRLQKSNPDVYKKLLDQANTHFNIESDPEALRELEVRSGKKDE